MKFAAKIAAVQFDDRDVRVAVVKTGGKLPVVLETHHARAEYDDPELRQEALEKATIQAAGAVKGPVSAWVICAGSEYAVARTMRIPFRGKRKVAAVVPGELEPTLAIPLEELVVDHSIVREVDGETQVLAMALRKPVIADEIGLLAAAGVRPEGITIDVAALASLWRAHRRGGAGLEGLLHVTGHGATFLILYGKTLAFYRHLSFTDEDIARDPGRSIRDMLNTIRSFLAQWGSEAELTSLTVSGVNLDEAGRTAFSESMPCPVDFFHLTTGIKGLEKAVAHRPLPEPGVLGENEDEFWGHESPPGAEFAPLVGAAICASGGGINYDFMAPEFRSGVGGRSLVSHVVFSCGLAVMAALGYGAFSYADYTKSAREIDRIGQEIWSIYRGSFPYSEFQERPSNDTGGRESLRLLEMEAAALESPVAGLPVEWLSKPRLLEILREVGAYFADDRIRILNIRIIPGRDPRIEISGEVKLEYLDIYNQALKSLGAESDLLKEPVGRVRTESDKAVFTVSALY